MIRSSDGAMSEAGSSGPVKRALQSFGSAVGSAVLQHQCSANSEKRGEKKQVGGNQCSRVQGEEQQGQGERKSRGKCTCKARCTCSHQVSEEKIEPQLILLQILG